MHTSLRQLEVSHVISIIQYTKRSRAGWVLCKLPPASGTSQHPQILLTAWGFVTVSVLVDPKCEFLFSSTLET